ncbi:6-carboxytetrahydropterin synthase [Methylosinus sp. Sm6]|uniref:6-pyruvoyl trahydropterin synthase family protein n=1 Tax=Methylosinus sp. Sm6 TaxID=2866948 RepID=UPI001C99F96E|nr:6-carboxytetrahydropterin synthase [Methylosinus sp. Sm6]MBY6240911.1 6-carboxytetrahydropterin synthase [Methylosinus sp. Sm6]
MTLEFEVYREFCFEAAHALCDPEHPLGGIYRNLHGHSFRVRVTLRGPRVEGEDWVMDLGKLGRRLALLREKLDHSFLNELEGLGKPTLENLCVYIWRDLEPDLPAIFEVGVFRDTCNEGCVLRKR